ncbi:MAG: hypothetical protein GY727_03355 [Gammaproteobacteria bacterium]|nr:hypothetical protein [Gammaproteobacteria bacterium]
MNLHGIPEILGGIAAVFIVDNINKGSQMAGIGITILVAVVTGFVAGKIIAINERYQPFT